MHPLPSPFSLCTLFLFGIVVSENVKVFDFAVNSDSKIKCLKFPNLPFRRTGKLGAIENMPRVSRQLAECSVNKGLEIQTVTVGVKERAGGNQTQMKAVSLEQNESWQLLMSRSAAGDAQRGVSHGNCLAAKQDCDYLLLCGLIIE